MNLVWFMPWYERSMVYHLPTNSRYASLPFLKPLFKRVLTPLKFCHKKSGEEAAVGLICFGKVKSGGVVRQTTNGTLVQKQLIWLGRILKAIENRLGHFGDLFQSDFIERG
jgi:hypothetical protein